MGIFVFLALLFAFLAALRYLIRLGPHPSIFLAEHLATVSRRGAPLVEGLAAFADDQPGRFARAVNDASRDVADGVPLAEALARFPDHFPPRFVTQVHLGEASGTLPQMMRSYASYDNDAIERGRQNLSFALLYMFAIIPLLVTWWSILAVKIVPQFHAMFQEMGLTLPIYTRWFISTCAFFQTYWYVVPLGLAALLFVLMSALGVAWNALLAGVRAFGLATLVGLAIAAFLAVFNALIDYYPANPWVALSVVIALVLILSLSVAAIWKFLLGKRAPPYRSSDLPFLLSPGSRLWGWGRKSRVISAVCEALSILLRAGLPCDKAAALSAHAETTPRVARALRSIAYAVGEGESLSSTVTRELRLRESDAWKLSTADGTDALPEALEDIAEENRARASRRIAMVTDIVVPVAVLIEGAAVLFTGLAMFSPLVHILRCMAG